MAGLIPAVGWAVVGRPRNTGIPGMSMIARSLQCLGPHGFHRLAYWEWPGPKGARTLLCVHGLTRNGRDFDALAEALSATCRVVCPDVAGRGNSEWLGDPADYGYPVYLADMAALIARLDVEEVDWVGTSMGGLVGMLLAAQPGAPIRPLSDAQWHHLATHSARAKPDGSLGFAYDPHIGDAFRAAEPADVDLWAAYDAVRCPTLVLRGADSDLLRRADAEAMTRRGPRARLVEFPGIGHAPALMAQDQIAAIREFLRA